MEESIKCFFDNYNDYFYEYVSNVCVNLKKTNRKYQDSCVKQAKLLDNFPSIRKIIEDDVSCELSKEEVSALIQYLSLLDDKRMLEEKELFFKGGGEAYFYFKRIGIVKD